MKWLNGYRIRVVLFGFVAAILAGDAARLYGDFTFGRPTNLGPAVNSSGDQEGPSISADGLSLYFQSNRPGGVGSWDIWVATRPTTDAEWGPPENLGPTLNTPSFEGSPCISPDDLSLYFSSNHPGGFGGFDLWVTTRATKADKWGIPVNLSSINGPSDDFDASISSDGLELYFVSNRAGGSGDYDLWVTTRATLSDLWGPPVNVGSTVNSSSRDNWPSISPDALLLFFDSMRPGGYGLEDVYVTRRATGSDLWGKPVNLGPPVNTSADHGTSNISADGRTLYFTSNQGGSYDLWQAPISPIVDFNGDGKVDIQDLLRLIESWGKDDPSVDIGPLPWGDGKVDEKDLEVLMGYWGQEIGLIACWKLDEAEGQIAADSAGTNDAVLVGNPVWQPAGGKIAGALQFDGVDDCVRGPFVVDPAAGPLSVFAWVKGGAPGQVILSQEKGADWLMVAPDGALKTALKGSGRIDKPLASAAVIVDDTWHRVGLVWDGSNRILYVDDVEVAKDTSSNLTSSTGGLYIGAGSKLAAGTYWSGLIDDVRIYDRAVKP
jgi:hypothetical protein